MNCTLWCASYLLGMSPAVLQQEIGHSGLDELWPEYVDSRRYRGYSIAEIQDLFFKRGMILAPVFVYPVIAPDYDAKCYPVWTRAFASERVDSYIAGRRAILIGRLTSSMHHAIVYDKGVYIDSRSTVGPLISLPEDFNLQEAYIVCKI